VCHKAYGYLAEAATGKQVGPCEKRLELLNGIGLKDHKFNRMYISNKKKYYDNQQPILIAILILPIGDVLDWNGTDEYDVMAIAVDGPRRQSCSINALIAAPSIYSEEDVVKATELLRVFYKGMVCSVRSHDVGEAFTPDEFDFNSTPMTNVKKWWKQKKEFLGSDQTSIQLPRVKSNLNWDNVKIARARASIKK
jgi:hypothetical protein